MGVGSDDQVAGTDEPLLDENGVADPVADVELVGASLLVALLAIAVDRGASGLTRLLVPAGVRRLQAD